MVIPSIMGAALDEGVAHPFDGPGEEEATARLFAEVGFMVMRHPPGRLNRLVVDDVDPEHFHPPTDVG